MKEPCDISWNRRFCLFGSCYGRVWLSVSSSAMSFCERVELQYVGRDMHRSSETRFNKVWLGTQTRISLRHRVRWSYCQRDVVVKGRCELIAAVMSWSGTLPGNWGSYASGGFRADLEDCMSILPFCSGHSKHLSEFRTTFECDGSEEHCLEQRMTKSKIQMHLSGKTALLLSLPVYLRLLMDALTDSLCLD